MENVIDITGILAIKEIQELLELSNPHAGTFYMGLVYGDTLAEALRKIGIISARQIDLETWPKLRAWRDRYFPDNVKYKINPEDR
jgi:hypothetical protein